MASIGRSDSAIQLRLRALPTMAGWGIQYLANSRAAIYGRNAHRNLQLASYSLRVMHELREQTHIEYGRAARGSLRVFRDRAALERAAAIACKQHSDGLSFRVLSSQETISLEPALEPVTNELAGAIHYAADEVGNGYRFCVALADRARQQGVNFRFGTCVSALEVHSGRVTAVASDREYFPADHYVIAAGSYSVPLLRRIGIRLPVRPVKGYSVTLEVGDLRRQQEKQALSIPVVDDYLHAAIVPLEGALRVAGTAEFAGYDLRLDPNRIRNLLNLLKAVLPKVQFDPVMAKPWCGLRSVSVDGVPIIGVTPFPNLFVNTGHGHLGWTMAAGSAELLASLICDEAPPIDPLPYALTRF